jgi:CBS domain-containing protein
LAANTAAEMMTPNPVSIRDTATLREAMALFAKRGISAAPVIDHAGRPVGVLSQSDIVIHHFETVSRFKPLPEFYHRSELAANSGESVVRDFEVKDCDGTLVRDLMTPAVFSVTSDAPASRVVGDMIGLKVHRLFVVEPGGVLVGVVSALDVLRRISEQETKNS